MRILGISAFYHDSAAALISDGDIVAAAQEERFTRVKYDQRFPEQAIGYCLEEAGVSLADVDFVAFYEKPFVKFERLLETYLAYAPQGFASFQQAIPLWLKEKLFQKTVLARALKNFDPHFDGEKKLLFAEHHQSHAASAFYPSPFEEAVVLTLDGVGEWATASVSIGKGNRLAIKKELHFPHSLGLLYSAFTYYLGFKVNSGEYKLMGLAPYGEPKYADLILKNLIDLKEDGTFRLDMRYFNYCTGLTMTNAQFHALFGGPPRREGEPFTQKQMDIGASIQAVLELIMLKLTRALHDEYRIDNLCLAGGVALNCVGNGKVLRDARFKNIWIQPAAGDAGGALGAAQAAYYHFLGNEREIHPDDSMQGALLGPSYSTTDTMQRLTQAGAVFETLPDDALIARVVEHLIKGDAICWHQGRMEFGPRALGNRSVLADPRNPAMQKDLNLKIKFRESFRPFAPSVLAEHVSEWFELDEASPYMLLVADVRGSHRVALSPEEKQLQGFDRLKAARSKIPSVTHVDNSARIQTVHAETNPRYHALISAFHEKTGCPLLLNTSFNVRGEPIVCTPEDSFRCFMGMNTEVLVVENCLMLKSRQKQAQTEHHLQFAPD